MKCPARDIGLRVAIASCFLAHGYLAIQNSTIYYAEWNNWIQGFFAPPFRFLGAKYFLRVVGALDVVTGLAFLLPQVPRFAWAWSIGWGCLTAVSRLYFLSKLSPPISQNILYPIAEFLICLPNGILPILAIRSKERVMCFLRHAISLSLCLQFFVRMSCPDLSSEILKMGISQPYFYLTGMVAFAAWLSLWAMSARLVFMSSLLLTASYFMSELPLFMLNSHSGIPHCFIQVAEHAPIYYILSWIFRKSMILESSGGYEQKILLNPHRS